MATKVTAFTFVVPYQWLCKPYSIIHSLTSLICIITVKNLQQLSSNEWRRNLDTASNLEESTANTVQSLDERMAALEERFQKVMWEKMFLPCYEKSNLKGKILWKSTYANFSVNAGIVLQSGKYLIYPANTFICMWFKGDSEIRVQSFWDGRLDLAHNDYIILYVNLFFRSSMPCQCYTSLSRLMHRVT